MRHQNKQQSKIALLIFLFCGATSIADTEWEAPAVRTPARMLGERFRVMVQLKWGKMKYVIPFFVDPDRKVSILDERQFKELAYVGKNPTWDEVSMSGYVLPIKKFKNGDTEEAFLPDFVKSCCYGILGQDVLNGYRVIAYEDTPAYIEWFKIDKELKEKASWTVRPKVYKWETLTKPIFTYKLVPPERRAFLTQNWKGVPAGSRWYRIQGKDPQYLDKPMLDKYLKGKIDQTLTLEFIIGKETPAKDPVTKEIIQEFKWTDKSTNKPTVQK